MTCISHEMMLRLGKTDSSRDENNSPTRAGNKGPSSFHNLQNVDSTKESCVYIGSIIQGTGVS